MSFIKQKFDKCSKHFPLILIILFSSFLFLVTLRITYSRYDNFENGKFDLGNMAQMVWNTMNGKFMYLTDYFGTNMPRWGMSHVDPFLIIFVPLMAIFKTPYLLVASQLFLVIFSSVLLFKIAELELENRWVALAVGLSYLFYPAIGFILAWTDFHGVTAVMPFFLAAFYLFEKMYKEQDFSKWRLILFWTFLVLNMSGKEEIPLFIFVYAVFILFFRTDTWVLHDVTKDKKQRLKIFFSQKAARTALYMGIVSVLWFITAFFVLIPRAAHYRTDGYENFVQSIGVEPEETHNVSQENYFLRRYEEFGDTYFEVAFNMLIHPKQLMRAWLDGSKSEYFVRTFEPIAYMPLLYPPTFMISIPEFLINYTSTSGGVSTANIENHRISMIIVVLFISSVYGIGFVSDLFKKYLKINKKVTVSALAIVLLGMNVYKTFEYENFVYMWIKQAVERRIVPLVSAEENVIEDERAFKNDLEVGKQLKLVRLETKDRDCARQIVDMVETEDSVSGPDYMGAKLSLRETYALFPALYNEADIIIADIYARKVSRVLGIPSIIVNGVMGDVMMDPNYALKYVCGNLAVFERGGPYEKSELLPVQQTFTYEPTIDAEVFRGLYLRDFNLPDEIVRGDFYTEKFTYERKNSKSLNDHKLFLTFVNMDSSEYFQIPHLASYSIAPLKDWEADRFYIEDVDLMIPEFMAKGDYRVFLGLTDGIETQSIYLGEVKVK